MGRQAMIVAALLALAGGMAACVTDAAEPKVPTLSAGQLARTIEQYSGRTVRVCGVFREKLDPAEVGEAWELAQPNDPHPHGAGVQVVPQSSDRPQLDSFGCIKGRIAYGDGTLDKSKQSNIVTITDSLVSYVWYLHPA